MSKKWILLIGVSLGCGQVLLAQQPPAGRPAPVVTDPVARDLLATNPATPGEIIRVLNMLVDLGQAKAGEGLLSKLASLPLDDDQLADLDRQFGSGVFLKLSLAADLQPLGKQFADRVLAAANKQARDPAHIAALVERLKSPSTADRAAAIAELERGGDAAIAALIKTLAEATNPADRQAASDALAAIGDAAVGALAAILEGNRGDLAAQAAGILGNIQAPAARQWLLAPALGDRSPRNVREAARRALTAESGVLPDPVEAAAELYRTALEYDQQPPRLPEGPGGLVTLWSWDAKSRLPVAGQVSERLATRELAARLAAAGRDILPEEPVLRRLQNVLLLEAAIDRSGGLARLDRTPGSAVERVASEGLSDVEDLLEFAAAHRHPGPAAVAAEILGRLGDVGLLASEGGKPRALARAAAHPDRRLRFAAVAAIIALDPQELYAGSSLVADALQFFMGSHGMRAAVVGDIRSAGAEETGGLLTALGYQVRIATSNRELVREAIAASDLELVLVDMRLANDLAGKVVQDLRRDCRTGHVPVGLMAATGNVASIDEELYRGDLQATQKALVDRQAELEKARAAQYPPPDNALLGDPADLERRLMSLETSLAPMVETRVKIQALGLNRAWIIARREGRTAAMLRPLNINAAQAVVAALRSLAPGQVPDGERLAQSRQSFLWLASRSGASRDELYPLIHFEAELIAALNAPGLVDVALPLLGNLGTPACQRALVELASSSAALPARQAAAAAFGRNVTRHGILLTRAQIARQYDRYNASESQDRQSQSVLATLLDDMEAYAARQAARGPAR
jgi:hypothetical protein